MKYCLTTYITLQSRYTTMLNRAAVGIEELSAAKAVSSGQFVVLLLLLVARIPFTYVSTLHASVG